MLGPEDWCDMLRFSGSSQNPGSSVLDVVVGPAIFLVDIWGLAVKEWESLVPAYTSSSIFFEKLRSGDAGERDNVSGEMGSGSGVSGVCNMFSWLPWLFSRKSMLL